MRTRAAVSSKSFRRCSLRSATRPAPSYGRIFASPQPYVPATDVRFCYLSACWGEKEQRRAAPRPFWLAGL